MSAKILVTGATGKVGSELLAVLQEKGIAVRAGVRNRDKAQAIAGPGTEIVDLDFEKPETLASALSGVDTLALITPPDHRQVDWATLAIDMAVQAGVERIVRLSVLAAQMEPGIQLGRWHRTVERYLQAAGPRWSIVRPGPFMQNFLGMYPSTDGHFSLPVGDARVCHIDVADVGRALAEVIIGQGHDGKIYTVTGGEALTMDEATRILSRESGRDFGFSNVSPEITRQAMLDAGRPEWLTGILSQLFAALSTGAVAVTTPTLEELTGRGPTSFETFARRTAAACPNRKPGHKAA